MSSPRFAPWLMPDTISSGTNSSSPSTAKRTQSTGGPSVAKPLVPSPNSTSSTQSGLRVVIERAVALRFESGAITASSTPGTSRSARRITFSPVAWMPSSLVSRTFIRALRLVANGLEVEAVRWRGVARLVARAALQPPLEIRHLEAAAAHREHGPHERSDHSPHEAVGLDPEGERPGLVGPFGARHLALEACVVGVGEREGREVVRAGNRQRAGVERLALERLGPVQRPPALERVGHLAGEHAVAIGARAGVPARVEAVGG